MAKEVLAPVGVREISNKFSALTERVNQTGSSLTVLKNNKPWVVIYPADAEAKERQRRREAFKKLTWQIEHESLEEREWDHSLTDEEILAEELMRRYG